MSPSMRDLRAVMEDAGDGMDHPADRLDLVRRRVGRSRRRRLAAGAAAVALGVGAVFAFLPSSEGTTSQFVQPGPTPPLSGRPVTGLPESAEGMRLVTAVKYDVLNRPAHLTFTPTGPTSLIIFRCDQPGAVYQRGVGAVGCGSPPTPDTPPTEPNGGSSYHDTTAGVPVSMDLFATGEGVRSDISDADSADRYLAGAARENGGWTVAVYSGTCTSPHCQSVEEFKEHPGPREPEDPAAGREPLSTRTGTADSRRTPVRTEGHGVDLHLVCAEGAAWAVTWLDGRISRPIPCEAAESSGVHWSAGPGRLEIAVFPASANPTANKAAIARLMKHPDPMGAWTLKVYE
ncbi:hypothetical protein EDD29_4520 [Actinocorallia herbida]|uniref:Uncharacterized protein n=1 Tax=Actinocorallia herbida TaxID=58109 RepID=A0A3N1D081_9ACTN|nr:hypothetical protein [Actinocorallia herbida]ROO86934.1 hypothetical protein EDD29_4520 [Actinocorallia herbida]